MVPTSTVGFKDLLYGVACARCTFAPARRLDGRVVSEITFYTIEQNDVDRLAARRKATRVELLLEEPHFMVMFKDSTYTPYQLTLAVPMPRLNPMSGAFVWEVCMECRACRSVRNEDWDELAGLVVELLSNTVVLPVTVLPRLTSRRR